VLIAKMLCGVAATGFRTEGRRTGLWDRWHLWADNQVSAG